MQEHRLGHVDGSLVMGDHQGDEIPVRVADESTVRLRHRRIHLRHGRLGFLVERPPFLAPLTGEERGEAAREDRQADGSHQREAEWVTGEDHGGIGVGGGASDQS